MPSVSNPAPDVSVEKNKFRSPSGQHYTRSLFLETSPNKDTALYTLKDYDHKGYPSIRRLYFDLSDPTEYIFATKYLDSWDHWQLLQGCTWFKPQLIAWRKEFALKLKADHLSKIIQTAKGNSREALSASKYLLERGWEKELALKGRPSKEQIYEEARRLSETHSTRIDEDLERIQPTLQFSSFKINK